MNNVIFGYTVANDISARDFQFKRNGGQFLLGKSMDQFCPLGPAVVPKEYINVDQLTLKTYVNGKIKQDGRMDDIIFNVPFIVSYLSQ